MLAFFPVVRAKASQKPVEVCAFCPLRTASSQDKASRGRKCEIYMSKTFIN